MKRTLVVLFLSLAFLVAGAHEANAINPPNRSQCEAIYRQYRAWGQSHYVARTFANIAWRESGCVAQHVNDADDLAYSRLGLNFKGSNWKYWKRLCGISDYRTMRIFKVDLLCALAAYKQIGWRPWS